MADQDNASGSPQPVMERRVAFERLRERTDELELIVSGISLVALVALPGWLFAQWARLEVHAEGIYHSIVSFGFPLAIGLSYTLAGVFLLHLATRAYWVGLIGLKATFPRGIRWDRVDSFGPVMRDNYRHSLADFDTAIDAADRFASVVFAVVSLVALSILWIGGVMAVIAALALLVVRFAEVSERTATLVLAALGSFMFVIALLIPILDRGSAWLRGPGKPPSAGLRRLIGALAFVQGFLFPQRLLLPVQFMLESNLPRRTFSIAFGALMFLTAFIGVVQLSAAQRFAPFIGGYEFLDDKAAAAGLRTAYYENLRAADDALLRVPTIPSDLVDDAYLRIFLPYVPDRDNALLEERCDASADRHACVAGLWTLGIDGRALDASSFESAERRDLGMRGLQGYVPMAGLAAGRHELQIVWNAAGGERRSRKAKTYVIPFWFAPPYQLDYAPPAGVADPAPVEPVPESPPASSEVPATP